MHAGDEARYIVYIVSSWYYWIIDQGMISYHLTVCSAGHLETVVDMSLQVEGHHLVHVMTLHVTGQLAIDLLSRYLTVYHIVFSYM